MEKTFAQYTFGRCKPKEEQKTATLCWKCIYALALLWQEAGDAPALGRTGEFGKVAEEMEATILRCGPSSELDPQNWDPEGWKDSWDNDH